MKTAQLIEDLAEQIVAEVQGEYHFDDPEVAHFIRGASEDALRKAIAKTRRLTRKKVLQEIAEREHAMATIE